MVNLFNKSNHKKFPANLIPFVTFITCLVFLYLFSQYFQNASARTGIGNAPRHLSAEYPAPQLDLNKHSYSKPAYGGTMVWGSTNTPMLINPILTYVSVSTSLLELIFDPLVHVNGKSQIVPGLAASWEVSDNGLTYTFHLRKGVRFHDGVELTADDVKFTYDEISDPKNNSPWRGVEGIHGQWEVIDKYTLKLFLTTPDATILRKLTREIPPRHLLIGQDLNTASFNYHPVGTGPFKLAEWDRTTNQIVLVANMDYFEGRPYLDKIVLKSYANNSQLWAALMRQEVDLINYLNLEDYQVLAKDPTFKTYEVSAGISCAIVYNFKDRILSDLKVRQAIATGIDVDKISAGVSAKIKESLGPFDSDSPGFNSEVNRLSYDPLKARALLSEQGWQDTDGDGILEKDKEKLEINLLVDSRSDYYQKIAMILRQQLSEIGIKISVQPFNNEKELTADYLASHASQARLRFFISLSYDAGSTLDLWYEPDGPFDRLWNYQNPKIDELLSWTKKITDQTKRHEIYKQIHKIIYEDQPACFLFSSVSLFAITSRLQNTDEYFSFDMPSYTIKNWYITTLAQNKTKE